jgi:AraC family transcriptional regulator of adaptative response / DNA-3-methyladenine glycosylase II
VARTRRPGLDYAPPFAWDDLLGFLAERAVPGVEVVEDGVYRRTLRLGDRAGRIAVGNDPGRCRLTVRAEGELERRQLEATLRRLFDLDARPDVIAGVLGRDPRLAPRLAARPGVRVPGAVDGFELAARAVLGQQISVAGARTLAARIVERWGEDLAGVDTHPARLFPRPEALADADFSLAGVMPARGRALRALARAMIEDTALLDPGRDVAATTERLLALPGVGPWTASYIALRALGDRDAFPAADLGLLRAMATRGRRPTPQALERRARRWRPWRAYAVLYLWTVEPER